MAAVVAGLCETPDSSGITSPCGAMQPKTSGIEHVLSIGFRAGSGTHPPCYHDVRYRAIVAISVRFPRGRYPFDRYEMRMVW
jgi:hypothetical protein